MIVEAKRTKNDTVSLKLALEEQLEDYCREYILSEEAQGLGVHYIYGMAVVGTRGRVFTYNLTAGLSPLSNFKQFDGPELDGYRDAKDDIWDAAFDLVKMIPPSGSAQQ